MEKIRNKLPKKGKLVKVRGKDGEETLCFRCECGTINCQIFRCPITGSELLVNPIEWEYVCECGERSECIRKKYTNGYGKAWVKTSEHLMCGKVNKIINKLI